MALTTVQLGLRCAQLFCAFLLFILGGCVLASQLSGLISFFPAVGFSIFAGIFGIISVAVVIFLGRRSIDKDPPVYFIIIDGFNWLWFLVAFALLASEFGGCSASGVSSGLVKRLSASSFCGVSQAGLAFGVIGWILFCVTLGMGIWGMVKGKSGSVPQNGRQVQFGNEMNGP